jgi:plastocyanin
MTRVQLRCATLTIIALTAACSDDPVSQNARTSAASASVGASLSSNSSRGDNGNGNHGSRFIAVLDDCDPNDPAWAPTGGCLLKDGAVTNAEFSAFLTSPLSPTTVVGHPAWRNEPSYIKIEVGQSVRVTNEGGRLHTFTEVAALGGGRVPPLRVGLIPAPECLEMAPSAELPPGATLTVDALAVGTHRFQCCIHSWMRAAIKVLPDEHHGHSKT